MSKIALIIIYNHKFDKNIPVLEKLYGQRFSHIYHLVPFYTGTLPNVIAVYEKSFYFQGYIAQGFKTFFKEEFSHYFFIADDMVLNPVINENNTTDVFRLKPSSSFLPEMNAVATPRWQHNRSALHYNPTPAGAEVKNEIPSYDAAVKKLEAYGIKNKPFTYQDVYLWDNPKGLKHKIARYLTYLWDRREKKPLNHSSYPFVLSYSDILIVSAESIRQFIHYCGVFAATELWVELAIPTALALSSNDIRLQNELELQGKPLWTAEELAELKPFDNNLQKLLDNFPSKYIYLHPIKLSKWK